MSNREMDYFLKAAETVKIVENQADRRLEMVVGTRDTRVLIDLIKLMTNLYIPEVRKGILKDCNVPDVSSFTDALLTEIDYHMYGGLNHWDRTIPLVLAEASGDYSHRVRLGASLLGDEIKIYLETHGITDPLVVNWITGFKETLSEAINQN